MRFVYTILIAVIISASFALPVSALEYNKIGGRPAYPDPDNPRTESIFIHTLEPGLSKEDGIRVINNTQTTQTIAVYATDSASSTDGGFACKQQSEAKTSVGSWIRLDKNTVTLEAGTNEIVPFTISVPVNAGVGEHNGCILMQKIEPESDDKKAGINLSIRTGLRVAITVPGDIIQSLQFVDFEVERREKGRGFLLSPIVLNDGNVSVDADVSIVTRSIFGFVHQRHGGSFPVLRGEETRWAFELKKPFWGGLYFSKAVLDYVPRGQDVSVDSVRLKSKPVFFFSFPAFWGLVLELLFAFVVFIFILNVRNRKKIKRWVETSWVRYKADSNDTLQSLARKHAIPWEFLARVNGIKPPYDISGRALRVPPTPKKKMARESSSSHQQQPKKHHAKKRPIKKHR